MRQPVVILVNQPLVAGGSSGLRERWILKALAGSAATPRDLAAAGGCADRWAGDHGETMVEKPCSNHGTTMVEP